MKNAFAIIGAWLVLFWLLGAVGIGDFDLCFGPHGVCARGAK